MDRLVGLRSKPVRVDDTDRKLPARKLEEYALRITKAYKEGMKNAPFYKMTITAMSSPFSDGKRAAAGEKLRTFKAWHWEQAMSTGPSAGSSKNCLEYDYPADEDETEEHYMKGQLGDLGELVTSNLADVKYEIRQRCSGKIIEGHLDFSRR